MKNQTHEDVIEIYKKRAARYNFSTSIMHNILGMRLNTHRKQAARVLELKPGDTVVEIGCCTCGNFPYLQKAVGMKGKIIGVDLTASMLAEARQRVQKNKWKNVELIQSDAAAYKFPEQVDGILSTFAITMTPEFDQVIADGSSALAAGKKWVIMDFKAPTNWLSKFTKVLVLLVRPYGGTLNMADRHPWVSLQKYLSDINIKEFWLGMAYIADG